MDSEKLLACPFCGGDADVIERSNPMSKWRWSVDCSSTTCGMSGPVEASRANAIELWNARISAFLTAILQRSPNGEAVLVRYHPNGDWSVYDAKEGEAFAIDRDFLREQIAADPDIETEVAANNTEIPSSSPTPENGLREALDEGMVAVVAALDRCSNTLFMSHHYWLQAAKEALQGDLGKLRKHVAISEGFTRETVLDGMASALQHNTGDRDDG